MDNVRDALNAPDRAIRHLIEDFGATRRDLTDLGLTGYAADKWLSATSPRPLAPARAIQIPPVGLADTVALVPMGPLGRRYLSHHVYLRDAQLQGQILLCATHIGWSDGGQIPVVRPITRRWRIGSAAAIPSTGVAHLSGITSEPDLNTEWKGLATLVELGAPVTVGLPLGFAPNPKGGAPAIPGVRHHLLADLLATARSGGTLMSAPKLPKKTPAKPGPPRGEASSMPGEHPVVTIDQVKDKYGGLLAVGRSREYVTVGGQPLPVEEARKLPALISQACEDAEEWQAAQASRQAAT